MPPVLNVLKKIIYWIHDILKIPIDIGNGFVINLYGVWIFVMMLVLLLKFFTLDNVIYTADTVERYAGRVRFNLRYRRRRRNNNESRISIRNNKQ